jgi:hypothetical protein
MMMGELACDTCGVWRYTRCAGIDNYDEIPENICVHEMCQLIPLIKLRRAQILWRRRHLKELRYPKNLHAAAGMGLELMVSV